MRTVNIEDLENNLSAWLEQVRNGEELIVVDGNCPIARLLPFSPGDNLVAVEEEALVATDLMRLPQEEKSDNFLNSPASVVSLVDIRASIKAERDED